MKRRKRLLVLLLVLSVFMITGCSNQNAKTDETQTNSQNASVPDESLTGAALIKSLNVTYPDALKMTTRTTGINDSGTTVTTITKGDNSRMEMEIPETGKQITIYNAQNGTTYQYTEGQTTGISFKNQDLNSTTSDQNLKEDAPSLSDLTADLPQNMIARVETLDGEKVIYIETTEPDSSNGTITMRMWFSPKYGVPMKYEMLTKDTLLMSSVVTDISTGDSIDDSLFTPPTTVVFTDYSNISPENFTVPSTPTDSE